jgi:hypothetical protein
MKLRTSSTEEQLSPEGKALHRLWSALPTSTRLSEPEIELLVCRAAQHPEGDHAWSAAMLSSLVVSGAVVASQNGAGVSYQRAAEFPVWPDNGPGSPAFNRQLAEEAEAEHELHDRELAAMNANGPVGVQRREITALIDQRFDERINHLARALDRPTIDRIREALRERRDRTAA